MSAVFGLLRFDRAPANPRELERMGRVMAHRGPDKADVFVDGPIALGHRLLQVNQEDRFEKQPLQDRGITLVADLRLDNREELARACGLSTGALAQMPDSAVLLKAYQKWGGDCVHHLLGDFAFALWDAKEQTLTLGRDHMGQRTLLYHQGAGFFAFASETRALWALADVPRRLDDLEMARFVLLRPDGRAPGATLYAGIFGLAPGTVMTIARDGRTTTSRYWTPAPAKAHQNRDEAYYIAAYRETLAEAVACRVRRLIKPPSLFLSGGFDSSAIAGLAGAALPPGMKLLGFSSLVAEAQRGTVDDIRPRIEQCRRVMPHLDSRGVVIEPQSPLLGVEQYFVVNEGPAPGNHDQLERMYRLAARESRLMMDGMGGDYTLNPRGHAALAWQLRHGHLPSFVSELKAWHARSGRGYMRILASEVVTPLLPSVLSNAIHRWWYGRSGEGYQTLLAPGMLQRLRNDGGLGTAKPNYFIPPTRMRERALQMLLRLAHRAINSPVGAAAHGLDFTRPFHDRRVVELGLAIPEALYVVGGRSRYLACRALVDIYPVEFLTRDRRNEALTPNIASDIESIVPGMAQEARRLSSDSRLEVFFDLPHAERILSRPTTALRKSQMNEQGKAMRAVLMARFVQWFERGRRNDGPPN